MNIFMIQVPVLTKQSELDTPMICDCSVDEQGLIIYELKTALGINSKY